MRLDHDAIAPLIHDLQVQGQRVSVTFVCPVTGSRVTAAHQLPRSMGGEVARVASRSVLWSLQSALSRFIYSLLGHGIVGSAAATAARTASSGVRTDSLVVTTAQKEAAAVEAFRSVQSRFVWVEGRWISAQAAQKELSVFDRAVATNAPTHPYDQQVLARMLVEVARADRRISSSESSWLTDMLPAEVGSVREISERPSLTPEELAETSPNTRPTLLMLAWTLALVDEEFTDDERTVLDRFTAGLKLSPSQAKEARGAAQEQVLGALLEQAMSFSTHDEHAREQLDLLAERLGVSESEARAIEARVQRRLAGG